MAQDPQLPARKNDVSECMKPLMDQIKNLYEANEPWKNEILDHFDFVAENIRHDCRERQY